MSTDRMAWALAAWEVYCVTGERSWLRTAYDIIRRSAEADLLTAYDPETGLFRSLQPICTSRVAMKTVESSRPMVEAPKGAEFTTKERSQRRRTKTKRLLKDSIQCD